MFAVTGITGNVGSEVARNLLAARRKVRGVMRDTGKSGEWETLGCEIVAADINDCAALAAAFRGTEGAFILVPPTFDPSPDFREARAIAASLTSALDEARPERVVYLSTIGAQATRTNLLSQHTMIEQALRKMTLPITFLRPAWFIENSRWDIPSAKKGAIASFLQPLDKPVPMVATADIGRVAAEFLMQPWSGYRTVELEGPHRVTPDEIAATFAELLGHPVKAGVVLHESWEPLFKSQGMNNPTPRIQMLDGFNEGWIEFEGGEAGSLKGKVPLKTALRGLLQREGAASA